MTKICLQLKNWIEKNSSPEFLIDLREDFNCSIDTLICFILEAKLEAKILKKGKGELNYIIMFMEGTNFINFNFGKTSTKFHFSFIDIRTNEILFRRDLGERKKI